MPFRKLPYFRELCRLRFNDVEEFITRTDAGAVKEVAGFSAWVKANTQGMTPQEQEDFIDHYYDELATVRDIVPAYLRYSQVLVTYGLFESLAASLCRVLHSDKITKTPPDGDLHLHDVRDYLSKKAGFAPMAFSPTWGFVDSTRLVRNAIAHGGGHIGKNSQGRRARQFIKQEPLLSVDDSNQVVIADGFVKKLLDGSKATLFGLIVYSEGKYPA